MHAISGLFGIDRFMRYLKAGVLQLMIADMSDPECPDCGNFFLECTCIGKQASKESYLAAVEHTNDMIKVLTFFYLDFFKKIPDGTFEEFRDHTLEGIDMMLQNINELYADHIEGMQKQRREDAPSNSSDSKAP